MRPWDGRGIMNNGQSRRSTLLDTGRQRHGISDALVVGTRGRDAGREKDADGMTVPVIIEAGDPIGKGESKKIVGGKDVEHGEAIQTCL